VLLFKRDLLQLHVTVIYESINVTTLPLLMISK